MRGSRSDTAIDDAAVLKAELARVDAQLESAIRDKTQADLLMSPDGPASEEAEKALAAAQRRKLELEQLIRTADARAAVQRRQARSTLDEMRRDAEAKVQRQRQQLQVEYDHAANAMASLRAQKQELETRFELERHRLEVEADRIRTEVETARRSAEQNAADIRKQHEQADRRVRVETEARLAQEREKLEQELTRSTSSLSSAQGAVEQAESQRRAAEMEMQRVQAQIKAQNDARGRLESARAKAAKGKGSLPNTSDASALTARLEKEQARMAEANRLLTDASQKRDAAQRAQLNAQAKLAKQAMAEEETRYRLKFEAESWLSEEKAKAETDVEKAREYAKAIESIQTKKQAKHTAAKAADADMFSDIQSQLDGEASSFSHSSILEHSLELREYTEEKASMAKEAHEQAKEEKEKAVSALERARAQISALQDKD